MRESMRTVAGAIVAGVVMACAAGTADAATTHTVFVIDFDFVTNGPGGVSQPVVIELGDTVRWEFVEGVHTTTAVLGLSEFWDSGVQFENGVFEHTFTNLGAFPYYCAIHGFDNGDGTAEGMAGLVTVVPAPGAAAAAGLLALGSLRRRR